MNLLHLLTFLFLTSSWAAIHLQNAEEMRNRWGLERYPYRNTLSNIKIAVLDNGFSGYEKDGKYLPTSTVLVTEYDAEFVKKYNLGDPAFKQAPALSDHGRIMAQIAWGVTGENADGPKFYLLNANGITNFRRAVRYAIEEKVDLILYSQNRECCGNFDGRGFLNDIVNSATSAGIVWINAAGNYGGQVFNGPFNSNSDLRIRSHLDDNTAQIILNWESTGLEEESGTEKDLDLFLYDEDGKEVAKSELKQVLKKEKLEDNETYLARERIKFTFSMNKEGTYRLRVRRKSTNFRSQDTMRIVVIPEKADAMEFLDATKGEEIMVPADNPNVIAVGDLRPYSAKGPTKDGRSKPDLLLDSSVATFSNGQSSEGTSNAAAYFAGIVAVLKSYNPNITRDDLLSFPRLSAELPEPIRLSEVASSHGSLFSYLENEIGVAPLRAGRLKDGRTVLGIRENPKEVLKELCPSTSSSSVKYYIARVGSRTGIQIECFIREGEGQFPWQRYTQFLKESFLEIRQVAPPGTSVPNTQGVWKTPAPEALFYQR